jgi:hypothetical protein
MSEKHTCYKTVYTGGYPPTRPCGKTAKVVRDDKPYCGIHDPVARKAKHEARSAEANKRWADEADARRRARLAVEACEGVPTERLTKGLLARLLDGKDA